MTPQQLQVPAELLFVGKKARRNILQQKIAYRYSGSPYRHLRSPPLNKPFYNIGPLFIQLVWYILKQLFTEVEVNNC